MVRQKGDKNDGEKAHSILYPSSKEWFYCDMTRFSATKTEETTEASEFGEASDICLQNTTSDKV